MGFRNAKADARLKNIINGGDDVAFVNKLNGIEGEEKPKKTPPPKKNPPAKKKSASESSNVNYTIHKEIFSKIFGATGTWALEVNLISWGQDSEPKYDIRKWKYEDGQRVRSGQGITIEEEFMPEIMESLLPLFYDMDEEE